MDHRQLLRTVAAGRVVVGVALVALPGTTGRTWIGPIAGDPAAKVMIRTMGVRDAAIGFGTLHALQEGTSARSWSLAAAASDVVDAAATILAVRHIGLRRALPFVAAAATGGIISYLASEHVG